ncbi:MAG: CZB domain-containing protein [Kineosporiaceae bacterium]|jgi:hypothetical protein
MGAFFLLRINDHMQYLRKISATLDGGGTFHGTDPHDCQLGHWLDDAGPQESAEYGPSAVAVFDALREPHEEFHLSSKRALAFKDAGDEAGAAAQSTQMHQLSNTLVAGLLELDGLASGKR